MIIQSTADGSSQRMYHQKEEICNMRDQCHFRYITQTDTNLFLLAVYKHTHTGLKTAKTEHKKPLKMICLTIGDIEKYWQHCSNQKDYTDFCLNTIQRNNHNTVVI